MFEFWMEENEKSFDKRIVFDEDIAHHAQLFSLVAGTLRKVIVEYPQGWLSERIETDGQKQAAWRTDPARSGAAGAIGDIGSAPGVEVDLNLETDNSDPVMLYAVLEICRSSDHPDYRALAVRIGDNIIEQRFHNGFFMASADHINARVSALEPLALLALEAVLRGEPELAPNRGGAGFFHGPHDGRGRTYDNTVLWNARR